MGAPHKPEDAGRHKAPELAGEVSATMLAATCDLPDEVGAPGEADDPDEPRPARPERVGRYAILSLLGLGGMGAVYAAYDPELDRKVALKLLHPDAVSVDSARMIQEARTLAKLAHPNVVTVHDVGVSEAGVFIAMEFVDGVTVTKWLQQRKRTVREVLDVFMAAGRGLDAAHQANVIHRDLKPDNMMVGRDGRVRVMDFGLARMDRGPSPEETLPEGKVDVTARAAEPRLTREGTFMGTPSYMAPEQWNRESADARTDQFSFCVSLWEALYGERPFKGTTMHMLMLAVTGGRIAAPGGGGERRVPAAMRRALERGLSLRPEDRFPAMAALLAAFERVEASRRRRVVLAGLGVVGCIAGGFAGVHIQRIATCERAGDEISQVWNEHTKASLQTALAASHTSYAESSFQRAVAHIDQWTAAWSELRVQTCREANVDGTRSPELYARSTACLEEHQDELAIILDEFSAADGTMDVARLVPAVLDLSQLAPCSERDALERRPAPAGTAMAIARPAAPCSPRDVRVAPRSTPSLTGGVVVAAAARTAGLGLGRHLADTYVLESGRCHPLGVNGDAGLG